MSDPNNPERDRDLRAAIERLAQAIRVQGEEIRALARTVAKIEEDRKRRTES